MNKDLRIALLEEGIEDAIHTIEFLYNCLISPSTHQHKYPEQTIESIKRLYELYTPLPGCGHSIKKKDCERCQKGIERKKYIESLKEK